jgi:hypothetical protein
MEVYSEKNFLENSEEIIQLLQEEDKNFLDRGPESKRAIASKYGSSSLNTLPQQFASTKKLTDAIYKTVKHKYDILPDEWMINKYVPGDFLVRHYDDVGRSWKIDLIILRSDKPHFKCYPAGNDEGVMFDESPGTRICFPINTEHEVTVVGPDERPRYTLVFLWNI